jgi:putative colanic acid biosynthesis acetyltransferase WcaF
METKLRKAFNKGSYHPGAGKLKISLWYLTSLLLFRSGLLPSSTLLVGILQLFGAKIGKDVRIKPFIHIKYPWKLSLGNHSWLADCYIENLEEVHIGRNVCISQKAILLTGNHDYTKSTFDLLNAEIRIEDGAWIGAGATVCPGLTVGSHAVLTVGSVATSNLNTFTIYSGNPAIKIKERIIK